MEIDRYILTNYNDAYCCAVAMQDLPLIFIYRWNGAGSGIILFELLFTVGSVINSFTARLSLVTLLNRQGIISVNRTSSFVLLVNLRQFTELCQRSYNTLMIDLRLIALCIVGACQLSWPVSLWACLISFIVIIIT